jgi:hypothetical protein
LNTAAISGPINLWGNASSDTFIVNKLGNVDPAHKFIAGQSGAASIDPGNGQTLAPGVVSVRDTINLFGGDGSNQYDINLTGDSDYIVNVNRIGQPNTGSDTLTINGVPGDDTFLLRQNFVALLQYQGKRATRSTCSTSTDSSPTTISIATASAWCSRRNWCRRPTPR